MYKQAILNATFYFSIPYYICDFNLKLLLIFIPVYFGNYKIILCRHVAVRTAYLKSLWALCAGYLFALQSSATCNKLT